MAEKKYKTLKDFYPFYLTEHSNRTNRRLHFVGTSILIATFAVMVITRNWKLFFVLPFIGYGFAWVGHFLVEKNRPATFTYPAYSLVSDFIMFWQILTGKIKF